MSSYHRAALTAASPPTERGRLGPFGEQLAATHLVEEDGLELLARNWRLAAGELRGELDLVAIDQSAGELVVVEVKTRRDAERFGGALAAISPRKAAKVRALTGAFLDQAQLHTRRVRVDVVAIDLGRAPVLHHLLGAL